MRILGNLLWIILGGWISALCWIIAGLLWCVTIIGLPVGLPVGFRQLQVASFVVGLLCFALVRSFHNL